MAFIEMDFASGGTSGGISLDDALNLTYSKSTDGFNTDNGSEYIMIYTRGANSDYGISSGATVISSLTVTLKTYYIYIAHIKATSTRVVTKGTNNDVWYAKI